MAEHISNEELQSMTLSQLKTRVQKLADAQKKPDITKETKAVLESATTATKAVIDLKNFRAMTLQAHGGNREALSRLYFEMDEQALMDTYDHYISKQREIFKEYIQHVLNTKEFAKYEVATYDEPGSYLWEDLESRLDEIHNLPSLTEVFDGIENVVLRLGHHGRAASLREAVESLQREDGF